MNRRGFFRTLAALIGATIVGRPRDPGPEALHLRFDHHGPATRINWTNEGAHVVGEHDDYPKDAPKFKKINMDLTVVEDVPPLRYDPAFRYWRVKR